MDAVPQPKVARTKCEFQEGRKRCTRNGIGEPALCDQHRAALEQFGYQVPRPGIGEQLGGMFDQMLNGYQPSAAQMEQVAADMAGALLGRRVTIDEVRKVRHGDVATLRAYAAQLHQARVRRNGDAAASAGPSPSFDPAIAAKIEHAKACGRARAVLGFTATEKVDAAILKAKHRELAKLHHPDRGGSVERMTKINHAVDLLAKSL